MSQTTYRRKAILTRVHKALDAFYLLQRIDWEYDIRATIERILGLAMDEIEFEGGKVIERALVILETTGGDDLEVKAGWKVEEPELAFSRTVVQETIDSGEAILCENAKDDPRFMKAESIKTLNTLSLISVPIDIEGGIIGAFYIESKSPGNVFDSDDLEFLREFTDTIAPYLKAALTHEGHVREIRKLKEEVSNRYSLGNIIGRSESIRNVFEFIKIAAEVDRTVLITGESGCGKELVAKATHYTSPRRENSFVVVDCSGLSEHLLESELFGHRKGAFTGASADKIGAFEEANGGTIFLDEISDASKPLQQKLRRVLQEGEIRRVGESLPRQVDVRVICATNKNLADLVKDGEFIRDLYFRINKFPIQIPPLRERREDVPLLVQHFLDEIARENGSDSALSRRRDPLSISPRATEILVARDWSENNIRELRNTVELAVDFSHGEEIDARVLETVFRVQRGELDAMLATPSGDSGIDGESSGQSSAMVATNGLVTIDRDRFRRILESAAGREDTGSGEKVERNQTPFYRLHLEFSGRAIIEGLRVGGWKLRPAARILGISPMKLRGELREFLQMMLERCAHDLDEVGQVLDVPDEILLKKAADLGLEGANATDATAKSEGKPT